MKIVTSCQLPVVSCQLRGWDNGRVKRILLFMAVIAPVFGDEGMWLFNQFPNDRVKAKYGVELSRPMLDHLRLSSVRVGASGSFVSANGLIFTNHHVVLGCVQDVSTPQNDYVANGFYAKAQAEEKACPGAEANVLLNISDAQHTTLIVVSHDTALTPYFDRVVDLIAMNRGRKGKAKHVR